MNTILVKCPNGWAVAKEKFPTFASELIESRVSVEVASPTEAKISVLVGEWLNANTEIIPCLSIPTGCKYGYQAQLIYRHGIIEGLSRVAAIGELPEECRKDEIGTEEVSSEIDLFLVNKSIEDVYIEFCVNSENIIAMIESGEYLLSISINELGDGVAAINEQLPDAVELAVPRKSQMTFPEDIRRRICSPTSIHMVEAYYGVKSDVVEIAYKAYNSIHDMFGIWPQNIWAMSNENIVGYICRIPDFFEVVRLLKTGLPLIVSINYKKGELTNAAIEETPGHLVVVVGIQDGFIICNDPAADSDSNVRRRYKIDEFGKVWIEKKGVAYVLIRRGQ
ncbi:C39 family peptidase [Desulfobotulus mexicanus]|uniref:Peptidase C39-like domain-containing protein n=1 Tax=Desulfobotulus mexicanus TaxID=2586642 RepID=A0A5Q4VGN9_9BACT|nr:C39 family peptidase [Desulfobotulus mexicanus]TYT75527.1 hypothetical protein FIM25_03545 [Desulfobotulus mexicanus]